MQDMFCLLYLDMLALVAVVVERQEALSMLVDPPPHVENISVPLVIVCNTASTYFLTTTASFRKRFRISTLDPVSLSLPVLLGLVWHCARPACLRCADPASYF